MKEQFDKWEAIVKLRKLEKSGTPLERADAQNKLKYFWFVWEVAWEVAYERGRLDCSLQFTK